MLHTYNFARERLAMQVIRYTFQFLHQWTNLRLVTEDPTVTAKEYFEYYPEEKAMRLQVGNPAYVNLSMVNISYFKCANIDQPN